MKIETCPKARRVKEQKGGKENCQAAKDAKRKGFFLIPAPLVVPFEFEQGRRLLCIFTPSPFSLLLDDGQNHRKHTPPPRIAGGGNRSVMEFDEAFDEE